LRARGRTFDEKNELELTYSTQQYNLEAGRKLADARGIKHVVFKQSISSPRQVAEQLAKLLNQLGLLDLTQFPYFNCEQAKQLAIL